MTNTLELLRGNLIKSGQEFELSGDDEYIGLYFSALWCPPCRMFTPKLIKFYNNVTSRGHKFEVIFISSDTDQESFDEYYAEMPWAALKFEERDVKDTLCDKFNILGFPNLIVLDRSGNVVTTTGRACVMKKTGEEETLKWES